VWLGLARVLIALYTFSKRITDKPAQIAAIQSCNDFASISFSFLIVHYVGASHMCQRYRKR
jgi:hypothetical protein